MTILRPLALLFALAVLAAPAHAQDGKIKIDKFNHSEWTKGIFSEAVTVTNVGNAKFVYLAGVGAEDENGKRGDVRHHGNFSSSANTPTTRSSACWRITVRRSATS